MALETTESSDRIIFRYITPRDASALRTLRHRAIEECAAQFGTPPEIEFARGTDYYRRQLVQGFQKKTKATLGGWVDGDLVCMAGIRRRRTLEGPVGLITSMFVEPAWRGRHIGGYLLDQAMKRIKDTWQLSIFQMNVEVNNEKALRLYQRHGFEILKRQNNAFTINGTPHAVYLLEKK